MAFNLATKFEKRLDERFKLGSLTDVACGNQYDWDGVNAIKVWTLNNPELHTYNSSASQYRFGQWHEVEDEVNTYQLTQKPSFAETFDGLHIKDQMFVKKATAYLKQVWDEVLVPLIDKYRLKKWAAGAGLGGYSSSALTKSNVVEALLTGQADMDDAGVPHENRFVYAKSSIITKYKLADEFKTADGIMTKYAIKGQKGEVDGSPLISVPDSRMPKGIDFMIKYKQASADPLKVKMLRAQENPPGVFGTLMEGLLFFDAFVLANKAQGIYIYGSDANTLAQNVTYTLSGGKVALASATASATIKYTTDGTNPKVSSTAATYSASFAVNSGDVVRAYASKSGLMDSAISEYDVE